MKRNKAVLTGRISIKESHDSSEHRMEHIVVEVTGGRHAHLEEHKSTRRDEEDAAHYQRAVNV